VVEGSAAGGACGCCSSRCASACACKWGHCSRRHPTQPGDGSRGASGGVSLCQCYCNSSWAGAVSCRCCWRRTRHPGRGSLRGSGWGRCRPRYRCDRASCCLPAAAADSRGAAARAVAASTQRLGATGAAIEAVRFVADTARNPKHSLAAGDGTSPATGPDVEAVMP